MKSPLRYPGGKTRAVKIILDHIPEDAGELCSPFFGGGSVELAVAERGTKVVGYDLFKPLHWFWKALLEDKKELARIADSFRSYDDDFIHKTKNNSTAVKGLLKERFLDLKDELRSAKEYSARNAAIFYALNRSSFSGETLSGGYSKRAGYVRFTDSSIQRILDFEGKNFGVECECFKTSIFKNPNAFIYADPPYALDKHRLYGDKGNMHKGFDHLALYEVLSSRSDWVLSYNDKEWIRELYKDYEILDVSWAYGMNNIYSKEERETGQKKKMKKSSEILIINKEKNSGKSDKN